MKFTIESQREFDSLVRAEGDRLRDILDGKSAARVAGVEDSLIILQVPAYDDGSSYLFFQLLAFSDIAGIFYDLYCL